MQRGKDGQLDGQFYVAMAPFLGESCGMDSTNVAAVISPEFTFIAGTAMPKCTHIQHKKVDDNCIQAELDIDYIRRVKYEYPVYKLPQSEWANHVTG
ncbi:MAG: hypothetical protein RTU30_00315 [Candidatus Thorarchaeota archaeon]